MLRHCGFFYRTITLITNIDARHMKFKSFGMLMCFDMAKENYLLLFAILLKPR